MSSVRSWLTTVPVLLALAGPGHAAEPAAANAARGGGAADAEEQIDEGLKGFGYLAGLSSHCVAIEQRKALEAEAVDLNAEITRLLGVDRAFLFAAGFGYGTTVKVQAADCKAVLQRYESRVARFRTGRGGRR